MTKHLEICNLYIVWRLFFVICVLFVSWNLLFVRSASAQTLGLSVAPPISEMVIIPGKSVSQTFTFINEGQDGMTKIYIIPFTAEDESGNVELDEKNIITASSPFASWFSIISPVSSFGEKFYMAGGARQDVTIKINPSAGAKEKDYYFTVMFELENATAGGVAGSGSTNVARIGANLLISLSEDGNPEKKLEILEFTAPKVIDSLGKLDFNIRIANQESYFSKPNGQITIKPMFGNPEVLQLAPLNVISNSVRNIPCLKNEETVKCEAENKVLVGIYKSTLEISADGESPSRQKTVTTIAFPFSIIFVFIFIFAIFNIIKNTKNKARNPLDNT